MKSVGVTGEEDMYLDIHKGEESDENTKLSEGKSGNKGRENRHIGNSHKVGCLATFPACKYEIQASPYLPPPQCAIFYCIS